MNPFTIADVNPEDPESVRVFLDENDLAHQSIHNALLGQGTVTIRYPLTYEAVEEDFLQLNAAECRAWADVLSLPVPVNISTVDPEDTHAMLDWLNDYQLFLARASAAVGL